MWDDTGSFALDRIPDVLGHPLMLTLFVLLIGLLALGGVFVLKKRVEQLQTSQEELSEEMSDIGRLETLQEINQTLEVSRSAVDLLDQFREELVALQFVRGANTAVIGRLDDALEKLHEIQPDATASRATADALLGIVREVKEMRLAYAATSRKLERITSDLTRPDAPDATDSPDASDTSEAETLQPDTSEYDHLAQTVRDAVAALERDRNEPV